VVRQHGGTALTRRVAFAVRSLLECNGWPRHRARRVR
jgi:hypothetical protein